LFVVNGLVFSNFLPRIPEIRDQLGVSNTGLGASLLGGGLGGIIGSLLIARVLRNVTTKNLVTAAATALALGLPIIAFMRSPVGLLIALTALGFADTFNDISMNAQGVRIQDLLTKPIMQRLHGGWSLGSFAGTGIGMLAAAAGISIKLHFALVGLVMLIAVWTSRRHLLDSDPPPPQAEATGRSKRLLSPIVIAMSLMAVGVAFLEATPNDWSSVTMRDVLGVTTWSGLGTVAFAAAMLLGRLGGDHAKVRLGTSRFLTLATIATAAGGLLVVIAESVAIGLIGFAVWGLGVSVMFPLLYEMAAKLPGTSEGAGLGAMVIGQRSGFMLCTLAVGRFSDVYSLQTAIAIVVVVALVLVLGMRIWVHPGQ
jgi:hypothetical protein